VSSIEDRIEAMWSDPQNRRERWLGFLGKLLYEVGGVAIIFALILIPIYVGSFVLPFKLPTSLLSAAFIVPLFLWVANKAFCNIIGR